MAEMEIERDQRSYVARARDEVLSLVPPKQRRSARVQLYRLIGALEAKAEDAFNHGARMAYGEGYDDGYKAGAENEKGRRRLFAGTNGRTHNS